MVVFDEKRIEKILAVKSMIILIGEKQKSNENTKRQYQEGIGGFILYFD